MSRLVTKEEFYVAVRKALKRRIEEDQELRVFIKNVLIPNKK